MQVYFDFGSAGQSQIRLHNENADSKEKVQKKGNSFSSGVTAFSTAQIILIMYGNDGQAITIPFALG